jgi:polysaccharide pyruvyl transferase WcaK-like protein
VTENESGISNTTQRVSEGIQRRFKQAAARIRFDDPPRIGLTGSFGRGNYGDELYLKVYEHFLGDWAELHLLTGLPKGGYMKTFKENRVDLMDAVVLGGGDLICPYKEAIDGDFIDGAYLRRPFFVNGVGVERNKPDEIEKVVDRWQKFLTHRNIRSITTRDPKSRNWLQERISPRVPVTSHPDLVCALPLPKPDKSDSSDVPTLGIVTRSITHTRDLALITEAGTMLADRGWRVRHIIGGVGRHGRQEREKADRVEIPGKETVYSESLDNISRALGGSSLVISMKLHTTLVATMYGVPTIAANPVLKTREFMASVGRSELAVDPKDRRLIELVEEGVPAPPMDKVEQLRSGATTAMESLRTRLQAEVGTKKRPWRSRSAVNVG